MIYPTKFSHPDNTLIYSSFKMLKILKQKKLVDFENLKSYMAKNIRSGDALFIDTLNFLFILGIVEYRSKIDSIEFVGKS